MLRSLWAQGARTHLIKPNMACFPIRMTDVVLIVKADSVKPFLSVSVASVKAGGREACMHMQFSLTRLRVIFL